MKIETDYTCVCEEKMRLTFKRPHLVEPTIVHLKCRGCASQLMVKFKKHGKNHVTSVTKIIKASELLKQLLIEQEQYKNEPFKHEEGAEIQAHGDFKEVFIGKRYDDEPQKDAPSVEADTLSSNVVGT